MFGDLTKILVTIGKIVGPKLAKAAANKTVQKVATDVAISAVSAAAGVALEKINDKNISFEKKLKILDKLKKSKKITEEEYKKLRDKLINSQ